MVAAQHRDRGKLSGLKRHALIRELALGELTQAKLAKKYDVTTGGITQFKQRHLEQIQAIQADANDEYAGLLINDKVARLRAYEEMLEVAMTPQPKVTPAGKIVHRVSINKDGEQEEEEILEVDLMGAARALRQAAEELGQIPNKVTLSGDVNTTTVYRIEGVSDSDLL